MKIDILGGSYAAKYKEFNSQRTVNYYSVLSSQQEKDRSQTSIYPFPGLTTFITLPGRYFRGAITARTTAYTRCFAVVDTTLYEILPNASFVNRGSLLNIGTGATRVVLTCDAQAEVGIFHYNASYVFNMLTNTLAMQTSTEFPGPVDSADYVDGYTVVTSLGSVFYSNNGSMLDWTGTNTFDPTFTAAPARAIATLNQQMYPFTTETIEPYYNDSITPYSRRPFSTTYIGITAKESLAKLNEGFIFLGQARSGEASVYMYNVFTYTCNSISPPNINWALNNLPNSLSDSYGYLQYTKDGHILYYITVPELKTTFVYNLTTQVWQERQSLNPSPNSDGTYSYDVFRGRNFVSFNGMNLFFDLYSGAVFIEDYSNPTENGTLIRRQRVSQTYSEDYQNISVSSFELDCTTGIGTTTGQGNTPILMLEISTDGGYNFRNPRNILLGSIGLHEFRARLQKLGTARNWVFRLTLTDPVDLMIQNCIARGSVSTF